MPAIYRGECGACGHATPQTEEGYAAIIVDEPSDSAHVHPDHDRIVVLAHPSESAILDELGTNHRKATLEGRFLAVGRLFCGECGTLYETRRLRAAQLTWGCAPPVGAALLAGVAVGLAVGRLSVGVLAGLLVLVLVSTVLDRLTDRYVRTRFRERAREFDREPVCPDCGERAGRRPGASGGPLPCPECGERAMLLECVGRS